MPYGIDGVPWGSRSRSASAGPVVKRRRRRRRLALLGVLVGLVAVALIALGLSFAFRSTPVRAVGPACTTQTPTGMTALDLEQAANATTIAAVGKRLGMPDHAVTVALATALQESRLRNLNYGDRDSLGVFQQRPSQGWGTPAQILVPATAAATFYQHLNMVKGWENLSVADAAQSVQRSADPDAYAQWEGQAQAMAEALTGEVPAAFSCRLPTTPRRSLDAGLVQAMDGELGAPGLGAAVSDARGWTVASWLIGHADQYGISAVSFNGQRWTTKSGAWKPAPTAGATVEVTPPPAV